MDINLTTALLGLAGTAFVALVGFLGIMAKAWRDGSDSREERYDQGLWRQIDKLSEKATQLETELKDQKTRADSIREENFLLRQENLQLKGQIEMGAQMQQNTASELVRTKQEVVNLARDKETLTERVGKLEQQRGTNGTSVY